MLDLVDGKGGDVVETIRSLSQITNDPRTVIAVATWLLLVETDPCPVSCGEDWEFHQATGIVAARTGVNDMSRAAARLRALANERGEPAHETALLLLDGRLTF